MKCQICEKPMVLNPSAEERARKDATGKSAAYYRSLFTTHAECQIAKRQEETRELMARLGKSFRKNCPNPNLLVPHIVLGGE